MATVDDRLVAHKRSDLVAAIQSLPYRRLAGFSAGSYLQSKMNDESKHFVCIFCHYRSDETLGLSAM